MPKPVLEPMEALSNRLNKEMQNALFSYRIANPDLPELDYAILVYSRDKARWLVYRSNMNIKLLIHSLDSAMKLMLQHVQNKIMKDKR